MDQAAGRPALLLSRQVDPTLSLDCPLPNRQCLFSPYTPGEANSSMMSAVCCHALQMLAQSGQRQNPSYDGELGRWRTGDVASCGQGGACSGHKSYVNVLSVQTCVGALRHCRPRHRTAAGPRSRSPPCEGGQCHARRHGCLISSKCRAPSVQVGMLVVPRHGRLRS